MFAFLSEVVQIVCKLCNKGHLRSHTRTARNTTLHHPSVHSDNDTDPKHKQSSQFRAHLDPCRNCSCPLARVCGCGLLIPCFSTRDWVVVEQVGGCHRQGPWVAKQFATQCLVLDSAVQRHQSIPLYLLLLLTALAKTIFDSQTNPRAHSGEQHH